MSQGTFSDTLIRLEALKGIYFVQKSSFFLGVSPSFQVGIFYSFMSLGNSACHKIPLGIVFIIDFELILMVKL